ncbi:MAG: ABC transporter ATP-binding protein [Actinobacteria bacterium]|nr:ABC transporter ATP-binding protein [Actinomycetota bacterium]
MSVLRSNPAADEKRASLLVRDVNTYYGASHVLQGVSLRLAEGEVVALLGRNGAGKTTLLRSIVGLTRARSGGVEVGGRDVRKAAPHTVARLGIAFVPSGRRVFGSLSVDENLRLSSRSCPRRKGPWSVARVYETFPKLADVKARGARHLSGGEQQMLKLGRALVTNPNILLLDEPTEGLAPVVVGQLGEWLELLRGEGFGVLLAEQNAMFALRHSDRGYILEKGRIRFEGSATELRSSEELLSGLGVSARAVRVVDAAEGRES